MPLTPEDVRNKRFTPVRLREGYDMGEVDQFLDEVEAELERLTNDNQDLRSRVGASAPGQTAAAVRAPAADDKAPATAAAQPSGAAPARPEVGTPETATPATIEEASGAAARLMAMAARNADEVVAEAKTQAATIVTEARTQAQKLDEESRRNASKLESDARQRAERLEAETRQKREEVFGDLESERNAISSEVEHLRAFEREYRSRLKNYFTAQLEQLAGDGAASAPLSDGDGAQSPSRLQTLLGEERSQQV